MHMTRDGTPETILEPPDQTEGAPALVTSSCTRWIRRALSAGVVAALGAPALLPFNAVPAVGAGGTGAPACATSGLVVWLDTQGSGVAAGSAYYRLTLTNLSGHACSLRGFPGVSAVSLAGRQLGRAAARDRSDRPRTVSLAAGQSAVTTLQITTAQNYPRSSCHPVTAAGIRVYPPDQTAARLVPFPFSACSRRGPVILFVRAVQPG
jgi:hypothetical protein